MRQEEDTTVQVAGKQGQEWIDGHRYSNCFHQDLVTLDREWCKGLVQLEVHQLIDENISKDDSSVYANGSLHC